MLIVYCSVYVLKPFFIFISFSILPIKGEESFLFSFDLLDGFRFGSINSKPVQQIEIHSKNKTIIISEVKRTTNININYYFLIRSYAKGIVSFGLRKQRLISL